MLCDDVLMLSYDHEKPQNPGLWIFYGSCIITFNFRRLYLTKKKNFRRLYRDCLWFFEEWYDRFMITWFEPLTPISLFIRFTCTKPSKSFCSYCLLYLCKDNRYILDLPQGCFWIKESRIISYENHYYSVFIKTHEYINQQHSELNTWIIKKITKIVEKKINFKKKKKLLWMVLLIFCL